MRCYIRSKTLLYILLGILSLGFCLIKSENVSAFTFGSEGNIFNNVGVGNSYFRVYNGNSSGQGVGPYYNVYFAQSADGNYIAGNSNSVAEGETGQLTQVSLHLVRSLPAHSIFNFSVRYVTLQSAWSLEYRGEWSSNITLLNKTCESIGNITYQGVNYSTAYTCTYWGYTDTATEWIHLNPSVSFSAPLVVVASRATNYVTVVTESGGGSSSGLTEEDKTWLQGQIQQVISSNNTGNTAINNVASEIQEMNERAEEDREQMQDNQEELEDTTDQVQEDVEDGTSSLTETIGQVVTTIKNAEPTNCNVTINPRANQFELGTINLCNAPQSIRNTIQTVVVIAVTLGVFRTAYTIFNQFMYYVRREQE